MIELALQILLVAQSAGTSQRKGEAPSSINGLKRPEVSLETL